MASHFSVLSCFRILQWPVWKWTQLKDSFKFSRQQKLLFLWLALAVCPCWLTGLGASELLYLVSTPIRYNLHMYSFILAEIICVIWTLTTGCLEGSLPAGYRTSRLPEAWLFFSPRLDRSFLPFLGLLGKIIEILSVPNSRTWSCPEV